MIGVIYIFRNVINNKCYVGKTINPDARFKQHLYESNGKSNSKFHLALRKYSIDNFEYDIIYQTDNIEDIDLLNDELNKMEIFYISYFDSYKNGYNMTLGGMVYILVKIVILKNIMKIEEIVIIIKNMLNLILDQIFI